MSFPTSFQLTLTVRRKENKYASFSYLDWRIFRHADPLLHPWTAYPAMANQTQGRHRPLCHTWLATVQYVTNIFHFLALGSNPWAKVHQNRRWPATYPGLPHCQISSPCVNPRRRYPLHKICGQTDKEREKERVNDIHSIAYRHVGIISI